MQYEKVAAMRSFASTPSPLETNSEYIVAWEAKGIGSGTATSLRSPKGGGPRWLAIAGKIGTVLRPSLSDFPTSFLAFITNENRIG